MDRIKSVVVGGVLGFAVTVSLVAMLFGLESTMQTQAQSKRLAIGFIAPITGATAEDAELEKDGALLSIEEQNAKGGVAGYRIEPIVLDDASTTTGDFDPAMSATQTKKLVANSAVVAMIGPKNSGAAKADTPILSGADLATCNMSATNPDLTDPKFASQYRPKGKVIFFRLVTTDAYQPVMAANFFAEKLHISSAFVVDDGGAFGVGVADTFVTKAPAKGIRILGRDQINPKEADYSTLLTKIKGINPQLLYYTGDQQGGAKIAKQAYEILPAMKKASTDALVGGSFLKGAAFPAVEGWYATVASPHFTGDPRAKALVDRFIKRWGKAPLDYSITAYDCGLVIFDAISRVAKSGKPVNRHTVRDAIQTTHLNTVQGVIQFDANGDLLNKVISVFQIVHDPKFPDDDSIHQFKYIGVAPAN